MILLLDVRGAKVLEGEVERRACSYRAQSSSLEVIFGAEVSGVEGA